MGWLLIHSLCKNQWPRPFIQSDPVLVASSYDIVAGGGHDVGWNSMWGPERPQRWVWEAWWRWQTPLLFPGHCHRGLHQLLCKNLRKHAKSFRWGLKKKKKHFSYGFYLMWGRRRVLCSKKRASWWDAAHPMLPGLLESRSSGRMSEFICDKRNVTWRCQGLACLITNSMHIHLWFQYTFCTMSDSFWIWMCVCVFNIKSERVFPLLSSEVFFYIFDLQNCEEVQRQSVPVMSTKIITFVGIVSNLSLSLKIVYYMELKLYWTIAFLKST